jgi:urea transport system substrate-binding protein
MLLGHMGAAGLAIAGASGLKPFLSAAADKADADTIRVGILHSLTGFMAISEVPLKNAEELAIAEINAKGGVLGKKVMAVVEDPASDFVSAFPEKAKKLLERDKVAAVFGCWTSISRKCVLPLFEKNNGLLFYPLVYEGNECSKNVIYGGATPEQHSVALVQWLLSKEGGSKKKFYLLGSDYIYPRTTNHILGKYLDTRKRKPVGERYVPLLQRDFKDVIDDIKKSEPDAIISTVNGDSNIFFFNDLAATGITADKVPVYSLLIDEECMPGLDPKKLQGHFVAANYFQNIATPQNKEFVKKYREKYGKDRATTDAIETAYSLVHLWALAVQKAKATDVDKVRKALADLQFEAPGGLVKIDGKNQHTWKKFRVGKIRDDRQFDIVFESKEWLRPDPYPHVAFPGRTCDWTKGGDIKP